MGKAILMVYIFTMLRVEFGVVTQSVTVRNQKQNACRHNGNNEEHNSEKYIGQNFGHILGLPTQKSMIVVYIKEVTVTKKP